MKPVQTTEGGQKLQTGRFGRLVLNPISRVVHGNAAGYANNVVARRRLRELRVASRATLEGAHDDDVAFLDREGYLRFDPGFDPAVLGTIVKRAAEVFTDEEHARPQGRHAIKPSIAVRRPLQAVPELRDLLTPKVSRVIEGHYQSHFAVEMVRMWRNLSIPAEQQAADHYSNLWHNDYDLVTRVRYFIYLNDGVTRETGALRFHPAPRTRRILRAGYIRRDKILGPARDLLEDEATIQYFEGDTGTACIMNPQVCLHRAGVPREGSHRDIVQFTFVPSDRAPPEDWPEHLGEDPEMTKA